MSAQTRPLSVVVLGNSVAMLQMPPRQRADDGTYGEVLVDTLRAAGVPATLHLEARWFELADAAMDRFVESVTAHTPDVLVVQYGVNEAQPYLAPLWLVRHLMTKDRAVSRTAQAYRAHVGDPVWRGLRRYRRWAAPRVGLHGWQLPPHRLHGALQRIIRRARHQFRPLVLVLDVSPPGAALRHWLPGIEERHAVVQRTLREVVDGFADREVRLVEASKVVADLGEEVALPDSIHFSVPAHRRVGELLAAEVLGWLADSTGEGRDAQCSNAR